MISINDETLFVQFSVYSLKPFPQEIRSTFAMPGNPYSVKEKGDEAREFFRRLGGFFYRDQDNARAVIIEPNDGDIPILDRTGFNAFHIRGILNRQTMEIGQWDDPRSINMKADQEKYKEKHGDLKSWMIWNKEGVVVSVGEDQITFI